MVTDQRLDLHKFHEDDPDIIKGQIVISMQCREVSAIRHSTTSSTTSSVTVTNGNNRTNSSMPNVLNGDFSRTNNRNVSTAYVEGVDDLPDGWSECRTSNGRVYYMNHVSRTTQWERPSLPASIAAPVALASSRPASSRSSGHSSSRHSHGHHLHQSSIDSTNSVASSNSAPPAPNSQSRGNHQRRSTRHRNYLARNQLHEAVQSAMNTTVCNEPQGNENNNNNNNPSDLLPPMPVGYEMRTTTQGQVYFFHTDSGASTWLDPRVPRDLLRMDFNLDELVGPLGPSWEVRHTNAGRRYFVDHVNRTTQFTDPRLVSHSVTIINLLKTLNNNNNQSAPNPAEPNLKSHSKKSNSNNSDSIQALKNGIAFLPASQQQKRRNLVQKMSTLRQELQAFQPQSGHCRIEVSRQDIFEDSYRAILKMRPKDLRKRLMIKFRGEEGLDYGGIAREWLYLLSHEMLNPYYGLFQYTRDDIYTLQINPDSSINPVSFVITKKYFKNDYFESVSRIICHISILLEELSVSLYFMDIISMVDSHCHFIKCYLTSRLHWMILNRLIRNYFEVFGGCCKEQFVFIKIHWLIYVFKILKRKRHH